MVGVEAPRGMIAKGEAVVQDHGLGVVGEPHGFPWVVEEVERNCEREGEGAPGLYLERKRDKEITKCKFNTIKVKVCELNQHKSKSIITVSRILFTPMKPHEII